MGSGRETWQAQKAKIAAKKKDWEKVLQFQDDLGPNLDAFEKLAHEVKALLNSAVDKAAKLAPLAQSIKSTRNAYWIKINQNRTAISGWDLQPDQIINSLNSSLAWSRNSATGIGTTCERLIESATEALQKLQTDL